MIFTAVRLTYLLFMIFLILYFPKLIFELDFLCISNLIFTACVACKNQVPNRQKIKFKNQVQNQFREIEV